MQNLLEKNRKVMYFRYELSLDCGMLIYFELWRSSPALMGTRVGTVPTTMSLFDKVQQLQATLIFKSKINNTI